MAKRTPAIGPNGELTETGASLKLLLDTGTDGRGLVRRLVTVPPAGRKTTVAPNASLRCPQAPIAPRKGRDSGCRIRTADREHRD